MTHGEIWLFDFGVPYGSLPSKLSRDSVAVIHLLSAVNKFSFQRKISKLSEENYQLLVNAVQKLISNKN